MTKSLNFVEFLYFFVIFIISMIEAWKFEVKILRWCWDFMKYIYLFIYLFYNKTVAEFIILYIKIEKIQMHKICNFATQNLFNHQMTMWYQTFRKVDISWQKKKNSKVVVLRIFFLKIEGTWNSQICIVKL